MDQGTAWEIGYGIAKGLPVYAWSTDPDDLLQRTRRQGRVGAGGTVDENGWTIENFGLIENLMIAVSCVSIHRSEDDAISVLRAGVEQKEPTATVTVPGHNLIVRSSCPGLEQARAELPEPYRHARRVDVSAHQGAREQAIGDMHAELAIGFELLFIEELVERALVREVGMEGAITPDQLRLVAGDRELHIEQQADRAIRVEMRENAEWVWL